MTDVHHPRPPYVGFYRKIMPGDDLKPCVSTEMSYEPKEVPNRTIYTQNFGSHRCLPPSGFSWEVRLDSLLQLDLRHYRCGS